MSQSNILLTLLGLAGLYMILNESKKKEGFNFQQADLPAGNAITAQPNFPQLPVPTRSDNLGVNQAGTIGFNQGPTLQQGAIPPTASPLGAPNPNFATLGQVSGGKPMLLQNNLLTSDQVRQIVGSGTPEYQANQLPNPDMRYSAGLDPTDPNNFIYDRTLFSRLKRRYGNGVDFFRGDIDVTPEYRGWFDVRPPSDVDLVQGYFDRYIDIQQNTSLRDSVFTRNTPVSELESARKNPWGDVDRLVQSNV